MAHYRVSQAYLDKLKPGGKERKRIMDQLIKLFAEAEFTVELNKGDRVIFDLKLDVDIGFSALEEGPCRVSG